MRSMSHLHLRFTNFFRGFVDDDSGGVLVMTILLLPIMIGFAALVLDVGMLYGNRRALQNTADAAALAGAREIQREMLGQAGDPAGQALAYAIRNGAVGVGASCTPDGKATVTINTAGPANQPNSWQVNLSRTVAMPFGGVVGKPNQCVQAQAVALAGAPMMDIMLSLDTTGSMAVTGSLDQLRQAVVSFINQVNPDPTNTQTARVGIARFAGIKCIYQNGQYVNISPTTGKAPCDDDKTLLSQLSDNKAALLAIADPSTPGAGSCPSGVRPYGCPIAHVPYIAPGESSNPYYTGTKLPNGMTVVSNSGYYAWDTARGGRAAAHKTMIMMTDGQDEPWPGSSDPSQWQPPYFPQTVLGSSGWDGQVVNLANTLRLGVDGTAGTKDDVEIFVVGYFCTPYQGDYPPANNFCPSRTADTNQPHPCPADTLPPAAQRSPVDNLLISISSSTPGTCDHYYPLKKTESLPQLFQQIAGRLSKPRLIQ